MTIIGQQQAKNVIGQQEAMTSSHSSKQLLSSDFRKPGHHQATKKKQASSIYDSTYA
jgi:hypothetical protein